MKARFAKVIQNRPAGLIAIVIYKAAVTVLFSMVAISLLTSATEYHFLQELANGLKLESKHQMVEWILEKILNFSRKKLGFVGLASALYALITGIETVGLWQEKVWAHWLVIGLVAISIFPEIYEIVQGVTAIKALVLILNVIMLWYLITHKPHHHQKNPPLLED